jgi:hypothetical protein
MERTYLDELPKGRPEGWQVPVHNRPRWHLRHGVAPTLRPGALVRRASVADAHRDLGFQLSFPPCAIRGRSFGFGQRTHTILGQRSWHRRTISSDVTGRQWAPDPTRTKRRCSRSANPAQLSR